LRARKEAENDKFRLETSWDQTRHLWATIVNVNVPKGKGVKPTDLIKLSFDHKEVKRKTPEEVAAKFNKK